MSTDFAWNELEDKGERIFTAWINDFRASYQFNLKHRLQLTLQYQSLDRNPAMHLEPVPSRSNDLASRLVYSYKINPRTVFYAGYSDHAIETDQLSSLISTDRTTFVKLSYGFDF
jgi:hypothetical protein